MLEGLTFVCPIGTGSLLLNQFRQRCAKIGFNPGKVICTNNAEALFTAVELDIAVALVPDHLNLDQNTGMRLIEVKAPFSTFGEHIAVGFNNPGNVTVARFLKHAKSCVNAQSSSSGK